MWNFLMVVIYFNLKVFDYVKIIIIFLRIFIFKNNFIEYVVKFLRSYMMKLLLVYYLCFIFIVI